MRSIIYILLAVSSALFAGEPLKMGIITDTHYLSEKLMDDGYAMQDYVLTSGKNVKDVPAVLNEVFNEYLRSDIQVLLVCGDITKDGEKQSHLDFVQKLKPLQEKGVRVFVIPGNHDINMPKPVEFKGNKALPVENISPEEFVQIYADCGYKDALRRDTSSLSYVAQLNDKTWLLAIDAARYKEGPSSSGKILPGTEKWITAILEEARDKGIKVVGMMHWGLTEHIMYQSLVFKEYLVEDWQRLRTLFADKGMKVIFTGHFHTNDITAFTSDSGNTIYDIETGTLSAYPFAFRRADLTSEGVNITTKNVTSIPGNSNLAAEDKERMRQLASKQAIGKLKRMNLGLSDEILPRFAEVLGQIFVMHAYGDEQMDDHLRQLMGNLAAAMDSPPDDLDEIELDFPPADNNVKIVF